MDNLDKLTIPEEFVTHYYEQLKSDLATQNIQLSKVGFAGFMFNLLGNTQFDVKTYYEYLFKEAFPITALDNKNLGYHSDVFGYVPALGQYSKLFGNLELNIDALPMLLGHVAKREINFSKVKLDVGGLMFTLAADYKVVLKKSGSNVVGHVEIITVEGKQKLIPFQMADPVFAIYDFNQYELETTTFVSPDYVFGTSYSYSVSIPDDDYVTRIDVDVSGESYDTSRNKSFAGPDDKVIFYEITPDNKLNIDLGSGINGKYIPGETVKITVYMTKGDLGNIGSQQLKVSSGDIHIFDYASDGTVVAQLVNPASVNAVLTVNIERGDGGKDPLQGKELRDELIKYIQSRDNLCSETDYRYILDDYFDDYEVLFKKMKMCENVFYVYQFFKDRYKNPIYTTSLSILETDFTSTMIDNNIYYPEFEVDGELFVSPFLFIYDPLFNVYNGHIVKKEPVFYSTSVSLVDPDDLETPPLVFLQLEYNVNTTTILIKSYQDIAAFKFTLNIPTLEMNDIILSPSVEENTLEYIHSGILTDIVDITIEIYDILDIHRFSILFEEVQQVVDISDLLKLKTYTKKDLERYIVNVSLIHKDTYFADEEYYLNKIIRILSEVDIDQNRMISDEVQVRLLNTYNIEANYLRKITAQHHNISEVEVTEMTVRADINGDLGGTYFELNSIDDQFYVWFSIEGEDNNDPRPDLDDDFRAKKEEIICTINKDSDINTVRSAVISALNEYSNGSIFKAYDNDSCQQIVLADGVLRVETLEGGAVKDIRDPDPTSNNPNLPTGFTYEIIGLGVDIGLKFPFTLKVELAADKQTIITNNIALSTELEDVKLELAKFLFEEKTRIYQKFYSSEIVDILHNRVWIKSAKAYLTDIDGKMVPDSNIEILPIDTITEDLEKEELLDYTPILFWWDLNNIDLSYTI
jgi:hypothetical protein